MAAMGSMGASGTQDVGIDQATTVGDIQAILHRIMYKISDIEDNIAKNTQGSEQQLAQIRVDIRTMQMSGIGSGKGPGDRRIDLIDTKTMSPDKFSGNRSENFKILGQVHQGVLQREAAWVPPRLGGVREDRRQWHRG